MNIPALVCVSLIVVFLIIPFGAYIELSERKARRERDAAIKSNRHQPVTIQPLIDLGTCMGSGACVTACPEDVLKILDGQAIAVNMSACVGHGVCVTACPVDAVELVFGSEERGIDIPQVDGNFETNVPGLYIAGELGGMGLIANAAAQGVRALEYASKGISSHPDRHDIAVVGAGPAGIAAALAAMDRGLKYVLIEQEEVGGAILHFPRKKLVFTRPMDLPQYGSVKFTSLLKEQLVELFQDVIVKTGLEVATQERVEAIERLPDGGFSITTSKRKLDAQRVVLALGRRGTPRQLGVPGEQSDKVAYSLLEPELFEFDHVLVVGGGDSAVEAACTLGEQEGNKVSLSYRRPKINRPKKKNIERLRKAVASGQVELILESEVVEIGEDRVVLKQHDEQIIIPNDYVFVFVGGVLPTDFLKKAGVRIRRHFGKRIEDVEDAPRAKDRRQERAEPAPGAPEPGRPRPAGAPEPAQPPGRLAAGGLQGASGSAAAGEPTMTLPSQDVLSATAGEPTVALPSQDVLSAAAGEPTAALPGSDIPPPTTRSTPQPREPAAAPPPVAPEPAGAVGPRLKIPSRPRAAPPRSRSSDPQTVPLELITSRNTPAQIAGGDTPAQIAGGDTPAQIAGGDTPAQEPTQALSPQPRGAARPSAPAPDAGLSDEVTRALPGRGISELETQTHPTPPRPDQPDDPLASSFELPAPPPDAKGPEPKLPSPTPAPTPRVSEGTPRAGEGTPRAGEGGDTTRALPGTSSGEPRGIPGKVVASNPRSEPGGQIDRIAFGKLPSSRLNENTDQVMPVSEALSQLRSGGPAAPEAPPRPSASPPRPRSSPRPISEPAKPPAGDTDALRQLFEKGREHLSSGDFPSVLNVTERMSHVLERYRGAMKPPDLARAQRQLAQLQGEAQLGLGAWDVAASSLEVAVSAARTEGSSESLGRCLMLLGRAHHRMERFDSARALLEETLSTYEPEPAERAALLRLLADLSLRKGEIDAAEERYKDALRLVQGAGLRADEARAHRGLANCLAIRGNLQGSLDLLAQADEQLVPDGDLRVRAAVLSRALELDNAMGRYGSALYRAEILLELVTQNELAAHRPEAVAMLAETMVLVGFSDDARDAALQASSLAGSLGRRGVDAQLRAARVLCDLGRFTDAEQALAGLADPKPAVIDDPMGQLGAIRARIAAASDPRRGKEIATLALSRPPPLLAIRSARIRLDAALALIAADQNNAARSAVKRGLKIIQGTNAKGLKLELLTTFHRAVPDHRVAEAAAKTAIKLMEHMPDHAKEAFSQRDSVKEVLRRWSAGST
ncbi:MAG TPA: 4Fe-4S dicluster domain-containing protein [Deltaproteobacteria bacterium]|nr:4Fe-4S dicluster domain-containing protein [Deltaproteobacteria bacterium]